MLSRALWLSQRRHALTKTYKAYPWRAEERRRTITPEGRRTFREIRERKWWTAEEAGRPYPPIFPEEGWNDEPLRHRIQVDAIAAHLSLRSALTMVLAKKAVLESKPFSPERHMAVRAVHRFMETRMLAIDLYGISLSKQKPGIKGET